MTIAVQQPLLLTQPSNERDVNMQNTFLGENFILPPFPEKKSLADRIRNITEDERKWLVNDLATMAPEAVFSILTQMEGAARLPTLVSAAVASRQHADWFSYHRTLSMLNYVLGYEDEEGFDVDQALQDAASLIKGYQHRTNMNLLEGLTSSLTNSAKELVAGNVAFDDACVEHLGRALQKEIAYSNAQGMISTVCELNMPRSLQCVLRALKAPEYAKLLEDTLQDLYTKDALTPAYIAIVRSEIGDQHLIKQAQDNLNYNTGRKSFEWLLETFSEKRLVDQATLAELLEHSLKLKSPCAFFKSILSGNRQLDNLQNAGRFVLDNLAGLIENDKFPPGDKFVEFAIDHGRGIELVNVYLENIRAMITQMEDRLKVVKRFDSTGATTGQLLNETLKSRYKIEAREIIRWRDATVRAIVQVGIFEFQDELADMNDELATVFHKHIGDAPNRIQILEKFFKIRQVGFGHDLGL